MTTDYVQLSMDAARVFTPGAPINNRDLFSGRTEQIRQVLDAIQLLGQHAILYGERGVGKTSLSNVLADFLSGGPIIAPRINCDSNDTYGTLWHKALEHIEIRSKKSSIGFAPQGQADMFQTHALVNMLDGENTNTNHINRALSIAAQTAIIVLIFDEFDRLPTGNVRRMMADTMKVLSDNLVNATLIFVGVADSVSELIKEHESIERALVQIHMPRMSKTEIKEIINKGLNALSLSITSGALEDICILSQGLPYYAHTLGLESARAVCNEEKDTITEDHIYQAVSAAIHNSKQSIRTAYYEATKSARTDNLFKQVLLACALSDVDEFGYFTAGSVREPLSAIMRKSIDIPRFARHLGDFATDKRGSILHVSGSKHRRRFRFTNPMLQPYVIMAGMSKKLITISDLSKLSPRGINLGQ